jgi:hypothetical protein
MGEIPRCDIPATTLILLLSRRFLPFFALDFALPGRRRERERERERKILAYVTQWINI